jgi:hypothetical protein
MNLRPRLGVAVLLAPVLCPGICFAQQNQGEVIELFSSRETQRAEAQWLRLNPQTLPYDAARFSSPELRQELGEIQWWLIESQARSRVPLSPYCRPPRYTAPPPYRACPRPAPK